MRHVILTLLLCAAFGARAQVHLSSNLLVTGAGTDRAVNGLGTPLDATAATTVQATVLGGASWAEAVRSGDTLLLTLSPPETAMRDGLLIRFRSPAGIYGPLFVRHDQLTVLPLLRADGLALVRGQLIPNGVAEVILATDHFVITGTAGTECPPPALPIHSRTCMDINETTGLDFYAASEYCAKRGGKLCTWDEYYSGCTQLGASLNGRFDNWEWIDDTSNHTHTADQVGRTTCMSQRAAGPQGTDVGARCCYRTR